MLILLLGATGQVGFELERSLTVLGDVVAPGRSDIDLLDRHAVDDCLTTLQPSLIVNAAAWTAVNDAEEQNNDATRMNAGLPAQLAGYAAAQGIRLVHYSSDYVYAGNGIEAWQETSPTEPINVYGRTKLDGDEAVVESGADYLIFRTSWVYSSRGNNFVKTMLRLGTHKSEVNIVADQIGAPTAARLIAQVTIIALHRCLESGVYHLAARGETSWHGFAKEIFRLARQAGEHLTIGVEDVHPIPTSAYPCPVKRPLNSRLDVTKLERTLNIKLPEWQSQLSLTVHEIVGRK